MNNTLKHIILVGLTLISHMAFASTDNEAFFDENAIEVIGTFNPITPAEAFKRTQSVLDFYQVPKLPSSQNDLNVFSGTQSLAAIQKLLPFMDPQGNAGSLFNFSNVSFEGFDDINSKSHSDFKLALNPNAFRNKNKRTNTQHPLRGLKIAIDPGHMGQVRWDKITGKYVTDGRGNYLSEGIMALQVSLLLKAEFEGLGAQVMLTRTDAEPVTAYDYDQMPLEPYQKNEIQESAHLAWFQKLLTVGTGNKLFQAFQSNANIKKIFANSSRGTYFVLREDLWARANMINEFKPDITLIVHFDVLPSGNGTGLNANSPNHSKVFIAGGFQAGEFASRNTRKQFAKKLLDQRQWDESISLSKNILTQFNRQMGLSLPNSAAGGTKVAPGIFSRNLGLTRNIDGSAIAYLECLFYNRPQEFYAFTQTKYPMIINGVSYPYSERLKQVVNSIKVGVVDYANGNNPL